MEVEKNYYTKDDVMELLGCKEAKAYQVIRQLNGELKKMGKIVISGKINKKYFDEKNNCIEIRREE